MGDDILKKIMVEMSTERQEVDVDMLFEALKKLTAEKYLELFKLMNNHINKSFRIEDNVMWNDGINIMPCSDKGVKLC